jgi:hypothetical protein
MQCNQNEYYKNAFQIRNEAARAVRIKQPIYLKQKHLRYIKGLMFTKLKYARR